MKSKQQRRVNAFERLFAKRATRIVLTLCLSTVITVVLGELLVYVTCKDRLGIFPRYVTAVQYNDFKIRGNSPNVRYRHKSADGVWDFTINSRGFRGSREFDYEKPQGVIRVLVLGDSFTVGYEVRESQSYPEVIRRHLASHGYDAEVINAGMSGNSNAEELVFFEEEGWRYNPDVVVLGFFLNDLEDNVRADLFRLERDELVLANTDYLPAIGLRDLLNSFSAYRWLSEHSYLHNFLNQRATVFFKKRLASTNAEAVVRASDSARQAAYKRDLALALVRRLYSSTREHGADFILLDIPAGDLKRSIPVKRVTETWQLADAYVDSAGLLERHRGSVELYRPHGQGHWTEFSHCVAGTAVGNAILERIGGREDQGETRVARGEGGTCFRVAS